MLEAALGESESEAGGRTESSQGERQDDDR